MPLPLHLNQPQDNAPPILALFHRHQAHIFILHAQQRKRHRQPPLVKLAACHHQRDIHFLPGVCGISNPPPRAVRKQSIFNDVFSQIGQRVRVNAGPQQGHIERAALYIKPIL